MTPLVLQLLFAAAPTALDAPVATARIDSITPDLDGTGGTLVVRPLALDGARSTFAFGGKRCRAHRVDAVLLEQLFEALRTRQGVTVVGVPAKGEPAVQCLGAVTFFAPEP